MIASFNGVNDFWVALVILVNNNNRKIKTGNFQRRQLFALTFVWNAVSDYRVPGTRYVRKTPSCEYPVSNMKQ